MAMKTTTTMMMMVFYVRGKRELVFFFFFWSGVVGADGVVLVVDVLSSLRTSLSA